jgi:hypothetical protein
MTDDGGRIVPDRVWDEVDVMWIGENPFRRFAPPRKPLTRRQRLHIKWDRIWWRLKDTVDVLRGEKEAV